MAPVKIYWNPASPPSRAVFMAVKILNIDAEIINIDLSQGEHMTPEYLKLNPRHTVPTMVDDKFILTESRPITIYLAETRARGNKIYPCCPRKRGIVNQLLYFDATTLTPRVFAITSPITYRGQTSIPDDKKNDLYEAFELLDKYVQDQDWMAGSNVTLADISILTSLTSIIESGADISSYSNLSAWYEKCHDLPGFEENLAGAKMFGEKVKSTIPEGF